MTECLNGSPLIGLANDGITKVNGWIISKDNTNWYSTLDFILK